MPLNQNALLSTAKLGFNNQSMLEPYLGKNPHVSDDAFVHSSAVLIGDVCVEPEATIWPNATLRGDDGAIVIGARSNVQDGSVVHSTATLSTVRVGEQTTIGHNAIIHGALIGNNCLIGMGSIVLDNAQIGDWCLLGAGCLITQNVIIPPRSLVLGSPGKVIRELNDKEMTWITYSWKRYVAQCHIYRGD